MKWERASYDKWILVADDCEILDSVTQTYNYHYTVDSLRKTYTNLEAAQASAIRARNNIND